MYFDQYYVKEYHYEINKSIQAWRKCFITSPMDGDQCIHSAPSIRKSEYFLCDKVLNGEPRLARALIGGSCRPLLSCLRSHTMDKVMPNGPNFTSFKDQSEMLTI